MARPTPKWVYVLVLVIGGMFVVGDHLTSRSMAGLGAPSDRGHDVIGTAVKLPAFRPTEDGVKRLPCRSGVERRQRLTERRHRRFGQRPVGDKGGCRMEPGFVYDLHRRHSIGVCCDCQAEARPVDGGKLHRPVGNHGDRIEMPAGADRVRQGVAGVPAHMVDEGKGAGE